MPEDKKNKKSMKRKNILFCSAVFVAVVAGSLVGKGYAAAQYKNDAVSTALEEAEYKACQYDYDAAIEILENVQNISSSYKLRKQIQIYHKQKESLEMVEDVTSIPHIFFHSLIAEPDLAFDGEYTESGYNQFMVTQEEFEEILTQLYYNEYVLVAEHDIAYETEDGFKTGEICLPSNKRPIVISQDDVNYYGYMTGDGFAQRLVVQDGKVLCEYEGKDGVLQTGEYDLIPVLDRFIEEHPDFSYRGAKAVIGVTGYEGVFGYHNIIDPANAAYAEECQAVREIAECLRNNGYELASHSFGHIYAGTVSLETLQADTNDWENQVESLIGETDIFIYPHGEDITSSVKADAYTASERFAILHDAGFRYFLNVDSSHSAWMQIGRSYLRGARRNIDGYRLYYYSRAMTDLFYDIDKIYDSSRPPVEQLS